MFKLKIHWQILICMLLGTFIGLFFHGMSDFNNSYLYGFITSLGEIFVRLLKMIIVPLIATSIICGTASVGTESNVGKLGAKTFAYYMTTSLMAILVGLLLVNLIAPGKGAELGLREQPDDRLANSVERFGSSPAETVERLLLDLVPTNPIRAMAEGNILQVIFFCLLIWPYRI